MLKTLLEFVRSQFVSLAQLRADAIKRSEPSAQYIVVLMSHGLPGGDSKCYSIRRHGYGSEIAFDQRPGYEARDLVRAQSVWRAVPDSEADALFALLENGHLRDLKSFRARVKDGVHYDLTILEPEYKKSLWVENPPAHSPHAGIVREIEDFVRSHAPA